MENRRKRIIKNEKEERNNERKEQIRKLRGKKGRQKGRKKGGTKITERVKKISVQDFLFF